jgi:3-hydroxyacyl-[acyl-carrier-protein] dehydratase
MNIQAILNILPHRYPFLLVDRVLDLQPEKSIVAIKNVTVNEPFFTGHFPELPIMPGVMILEALAQAAGILAYESSAAMREPNVMFYFAGIDNTRFKRIVVPGDQLKLEAELLRVKQDIWKYKATASVDGQLACSAEILAAKKELNK